MVLPEPGRTDHLSGGGVWACIQAAICGLRRAGVALLLCDRFLRRSRAQKERPRGRIPARGVCMACHLLVPAYGHFGSRKLSAAAIGLGDPLPYNLSACLSDLAGGFRIRAASPLACHGDGRADGWLG